MSIGAYDLVGNRTWREDSFDDRAFIDCPSGKAAERLDELLLQIPRDPIWR